jgi:hypothetical protein
LLRTIGDVRKRLRDKRHVWQAEGPLAGLPQQGVSDIMAKYQSRGQPPETDPLESVSAAEVAAATQHATSKAKAAPKPKAASKQKAASKSKAASKPKSASTPNRTDKKEMQAGAIAVKRATEGLSASPPTKSAKKEHGPKSPASKAAQLCEILRNPSISCSATRLEVTAQTDTRSRLCVLSMILVPGQDMHKFAEQVRKAIDDGRTTKSHVLQMREKLLAKKPASKNAK